MKKLLVLLLTFTCALCLVFALAGCNGGELSTTTGGNNQTEQSNEGGSESSADSDSGETGSTGGQEGGHEHNYVYKCSPIEHWQENSDGEEKNRAAHTVTDGVCPTCRYVEKCTEGLEFNEIKENKETIGYEVSRGTATDSDIYIPSFYNDLPVIAIEDVYHTYVPGYPFREVFSNIKNLISVTIGNNVTYIGREAFAVCENLESVTIPDSVTSIGLEAYVGCTKLTSITIGNGVTSIGKLAFAGCTNFTNITIPDSVTSIGAYAFHSCSNLTSIQIPNNVTSIGAYAFQGCTKFTSITIPNNVISIGAYAFQGCTNLTSITIGNGVTEIDGSAFEDTAYYNNPDNWTNDVLYLDNCLIRAKDTLHGSYEIRQGTRLIAVSAFINCTNLTSITIPNSVTSIGECAFWGCPILTSISVLDGNKAYTSQDEILYNKDKTELIRVPQTKTSITIPDSVTSIGNSAFSGCTAEIKWGDNPSIKEIGQYAFHGYKGTRITIPNSVTSIGYSAFGNCTNLTSVTIPNSVTSIGQDAFDDCYKLIEVINLSGLLIEKGKSTYGDVAYYALNVVNSPEQSKIKYLQDYIFYEDGDTVYLLGYKGNNTELQLPDKFGEKTYEIYKYAFCYKDKITKVTIPDSVTFIGYWAFIGCKSFTSVTIPNSVTSIGRQAFYGCNLTSVYFTNPNGWYCAQYLTETGGTVIPSEDLENPAKAATYLKDAYNNYYWYRKTA